MMKSILINEKRTWWLLPLLLLLSAAPVFAQRTVHGQVTDDSGTGIPGATVMVKGSQSGTVTDMDGKFSIGVKDNSTILVFSFVGYASQEVTVGSQSSVDVSLSEDMAELEEVVVVGYGTQKKSDLTGAIASVDQQVITERGVTNPVQSLQGSVAGVVINNPTGRVGDQISVTVRGNNTLQSGASAPLYVVDGVVTDNISFLNPQDIAKIDILKDASSAAIYGSRGSNGVVLIQTKGGVNVPSGTTISFQTFYGIKAPARLPKMMSPAQWELYHMSAYLATANTNTVTTPDQFYDLVVSEEQNSLLRKRFETLDGFDWYDAILKNGTQSNTNLSFNHRSGASSYTFGVGYQNETGNIKKEGLKKYTMRLAMDQQIKPSLKINAKVTTTFSNIQRGSEYAMQEAFRLNPFLSPWAVDDDGNEIIGDLFPLPGKLTDSEGNYLINKTSTYNPLLEIANSSNETRQWNVLASTFAQYDPTSWMMLRSTFSAGLKSYHRGIYHGAQTNTGVSNDDLPSSSMASFENFNYTWDNQMNLKKNFSGHGFNLLLLQSIYVTRTDTSYLASTHQPFDTEYYNVGSGTQSTFYVGNYFQKSQLASFAIRLNYDYKDKYLVTVTNRWDGSSLLAEGHKWSSFPSVALGWRIAKEAFMPQGTILSDLKIRASYGVTGNNNVSPYSTVNKLDQQTYYDFNGTTANGWVSSSLANKALTWEKLHEINLGVDYSLFNYRITGSVDFYHRISDKLLLTQTLPLETGYSSIRANAGSVKNQGVEVSLTTTNIQNNLIRWETTWTFTRNVNSIQSIYGQSKNDDVGNGWFIGQPVNAYYNYKFAGIWQADQAAEAAEYGQTPGQAKVVDVNHDGKIDSDDDRVILGSPNPKWIGGLISRLYVGNFDLNITVYAKQGVLAYSNFHANFENTYDRGRQKLDLSSWYIPENNYGVAAQTSNKYPQPRNEGIYWNDSNVGYYKNASFVKINNISLGYTLPDKILNMANISKLRVYVNVLNPFTFTKYTGYDPEWATASFQVGRVSSITTQFGLSMNF